MRFFKFNYEIVNVDRVLVIPKFRKAHLKELNLVWKSVYIYVFSKNTIFCCIWKSDQYGWPKIFKKLVYEGKSILVPNIKLVKNPVISHQTEGPVFLSNK